MINSVSRFNSQRVAFGNNSKSVSREEVQKMIKESNNETKLQIASLADEIAENYSKPTAIRWNLIDFAKGIKKGIEKSTKED